MIRKLARQRFLRFLVTGALSLGIGFTTTVLLRELVGLTPQLAGAGGLIASFLLNFLTVRRFVFASQAHAGWEFARYTITSAAFRGAEYLAYLLLLQKAGLPYPVAYVLVVACSVTLKFFIYRAFVFRASPRAAVVDA